MESRSLAFIVDGEVVSVSRFDELTAAIFLSNPTIVDVTPIAIHEGWKFDDEKGFYTTIDGKEVSVDPSTIG